jgi:hypothetical protein
MALNARKVKTEGKKYDPMEAGTYPARLVQIIDLGLQPQEYKGEEKAPKIELMTTYEFLDEFLPDEDGNPNEEKPRWLSETWALNNLDSEKAKSTQRYYALDPEEEHDGEWPELIETPVMVTVVQNKKGDKVYNNIASTSTMRAKDAAKAPPLVNPPKVFLMEKPDVEIFLSLPDWVQDKIKGGLEYEGSALERLLKDHKGGSTKKDKEAADEPVKGKRKVKEEVPEDEIPFEEDNGIAGQDDNW